MPRRSESGLGTAVLFRVVLTLASSGQVTALVLKKNFCSLFEFNTFVQDVNDH